MESANYSKSNLNDTVSICSEEISQCTDCPYSNTNFICQYKKDLEKCILMIPLEWEDYFFMDGSVKPIIMNKD